MIVDINVNLSRWPFRRLAGDEPAGLVARLRKRSVGQAWAGSFDGIFHKDIAGVNERLMKDCRTYGEGLLLPFGSINPKLPDWRDDLRRCQEEHGMPGIRLHPAYHGYDLKDPVFAELLRLAASRRLIVQLALCMEDDRTQHPLMRVPPTDLAPLAGLVKAEPRARIVVLNCRRGPNAELKNLSSAGEVFFEFSMLEGAAGLDRLVRQVSLKRVLFGSNYPLFYFESALFKVRESGLNAAEKDAVLAGNARALRETAS